MKTFAPEICALTNLTELDVPVPLFLIPTNRFESSPQAEYNFLVSLPPELGQLVKLRTLKVRPFIFLSRLSFD